MCGGGRAPLTLCILLILAAERFTGAQLVSRPANLLAAAASDGISLGGFCTQRTAHFLDYYFFNYHIFLFFFLTTTLHLDRTSAALDFAAFLCVLVAASLLFSFVTAEAGRDFFLSFSFFFSFFWEGGLGGVQRNAIHGGSVSFHPCALM